MRRRGGKGVGERERKREESGEWRVGVTKDEYKMNKRG